MKARVVMLSERKAWESSKQQPNLVMISASCVLFCQCCVYDVAFKPDGSELLVAADVKVLIYDGTDGTLLQSLKGHKDLVYAVAWSHNGDRFASGSADKSVIIWTEQHEGTLKYSHGEPVQCIAFNPVQCVLLSCAMNDFALWSPSEKNVLKQKVPGRIMACAWSSGGDIFAVGLLDGGVLLRPFDDINTLNSALVENLLRIDRPGGEAVSALTFTFLTNDEAHRRKLPTDVKQDVLVVAACDQSIYTTDGTKAQKLDEKKGDVRVDFDPTSVHYFHDNQFLVVGGSNKLAMLYTKLGTFLGIIAQMDTWVWCVRTKPYTNTVVVACVDGTIACYQLMFSTVHGLHKHMYAFRENMTDIVVQHLTQQRTARIRCDDLVRRVAIYNKKLAAQLSYKIVIYKQIGDEREGEPFEFRLVERIQHSFDCSLLVVCELHIILCQDRHLHCFDQKGQKQREWTLPSLIRYIKVIGGPPGRESILVGLKSGQVSKIFVDNPFPVSLFELSAAIRCLDISLDRRLLALVDERNVALVYDIVDKSIIFQEPDCTSISFNSDMENVVCYSAGGYLRIRSEGLPAFQQRMQFEGFVVGFGANKVYCLHMNAMSVIEVPFSSQLYQYIERKKFPEAFRIACLGVTEEDWRALGNEALHALQLPIARKAFSRIRDLAALKLIAEIETMQEDKEEAVLIRAKILAHAKRFDEVAELYKQNGYDHEAMQLFTDLRMFDDAQALMTSASGETQKMLMRKRADWAKESNEPKLAANIFISSGDYEKALSLVIQHDWLDLVMVIASKLDRSERELLLRIGDYLAAKKEYGLASKIYSQINESRRLLQMHIDAEHWNDAFAISNRYTALAEYTLVEYGRWLGERDKWDEAQAAFQKANATSEAVQLMAALAENAVAECRFRDAAYYHFLLSKHYAERTSRDSNPRLVTMAAETANSLMSTMHTQPSTLIIILAFIYIQHQPFTPDTRESLLHRARFISFYPKIAPNVSKVLTLFMLANLGRALGAFKLSRTSLEKLSYLHVPAKLQRLVEIATVKMRAERIADAERLLPVCYVCSLSNPLDAGHNCLHCGTRFVYCFSTFERLPLAEFWVADDIPAEEALRLVQAEPPLTAPPFSPFAKLKRNTRAVLGRDELSLLQPSCVFVACGFGALPTRFFFNIISSVSISLCSNCNHVFQTDDLEMARVKCGGCPFCRHCPVAPSDGLLSI